MNAMKKWVVAGLIGLSSVGVSMAAPTLVDNFSGDNGSLYAIPMDYDTWAMATDAYTSAGIIPASDSTRNSYIVSYEGGPNWYGGNLPSESAYISYGDPSTVTAHSHTLAGDYTTEFGLRYWLGVTVPEVGGAPTFLTQYTGVTLDLGAINLAGGTAYLQLDGLTIDLSSYANESKPFNWNDAVWNDHWDAHGGGDGLMSLSSVITDYWTPGGAHYNPGADLSMYIFYYMGQNGSVTLNSFQLDGQDGPPVPEPETVWMMLAVLGSLAVTFRRQLMDLAGRFVKT